MNDETDVMLMAYVDGEMDAAARAAFEARLSQDMPLQDALNRARRLREMLNGAYSPVLDEPLPDRLTALLKAPEAELVSLADVRASRRLGWAQWGGMAASLMLGTLLGYKLLPGGVGQMADGSVLAQALDQQLSGQSAGGITPGLSFVTKGGAYCRSFTSTGAQASAGLACRDGQQWRLRQLEPLPAEAASAAYRTAATALPAALLQGIDALREGDALDAEAERQARARGWQR
ncbi:anti-sigma factor [soil metagenome]